MNTEQPDIIARVSQAGVYLRSMADVIAECYQVLTDDARWERPMAPEHASLAAERLVLAAMEMAAWDQ